MVVLFIHSEVIDNTVDFLSTKKVVIDDKEITFEDLKRVNAARDILKDMNDNGYIHEFYSKYDKKKFLKWMENPKRYRKQLRDMSLFLYNASNQYKRLVKYVSRISLLAYYLVGNKDDFTNVDKDKYRKELNRTKRIITGMNLKHEFLKIFDVIMREDVFYGYTCVASDYYSFFIKPLPANYCEITSVEDGCYVFSMNMSYFDTRKKELRTYPPEFKQRYEIYKSNKQLKWQELDSANTICIKFDESLDYPVPPFVGVFSALFDLEDYKRMKKNSEKLNNYKLLSMEIPMNNDGEFLINFTEMVKYYKMIRENLPSNIGLAITPVKLAEHNFEKSNVASISALSEATEDFWNQSGVSSQLFSSTKSGNSVMSASTEIDAAYIYGVYRQFERWVNYRLKRLAVSKDLSFRIKFIDVTIFNKDELLKMYMQLGTYGYPIRERISALIGDDALDLENLLFVENEIYNYDRKFIPFKSSHTSSGTQEVGNEGGRPKQEHVTDEGQKTRDRGES